MKFVEKNKKWLFLLSAGCFIISLLNVLAGGIELLVSAIGAATHWVGIIDLVLNSGNILMEAVLIITLLVTAIVYWIKGKGKLFLAGSGAIMLIGWVISLLSQLVFLLLHDDYHVTMLLRNMADSVWIPVFSAYLIVFAFLKSKGVSVPILGAALIVLMFASANVHSLTMLIYYIEYLFHYFNWESLFRAFGSIVDILALSVQYLGFLLLVPLALYTPKNMAEPVDEKDKDNTCADIFAEEKS